MGATGLPIEDKHHPVNDYLCLLTAPTFRSPIQDPFLFQLLLRPSMSVTLACPQKRSHTFHQSGPSSYLNGKYRSQRPPDKIAQRRARRPQHSRCSDYWEKPRLYQTSGGLAIVHYPESTKYSSVYPRSPNWGVWNSVHNESPGMPSVSSRGKSPANTHSSKSLPDKAALYCPHVVTAGHSGTFWRGIPSLRHGLGDLVSVRLGPRSLGYLH